MFAIILVYLPCILLCPGHCAEGNVDTNFCKRNTPASTGNTKPFPVLPVSFTLLYERSFNTTNVTDYNHIVYSKTAQNIYMDLQEPNLRTKTYIDLALGQVLIVKSGNGWADCTSHPVDDSPEMKYFNMEVDGPGKVAMGRMKYPLLFYSWSGDPTYVTNTTVRGIPADQWNVCMYRGWSNETVSASIFYSAENVKTPDGSQHIPLKVEAVIHNNDTGLYYSMRYDFTAFSSSVSKEDEIKSQIPADTYCVQLPRAINLPVPPSSFSYQSEEVQLGDPKNTSKRALPVISNNEKTLVQQDKIFSWKAEGVGSHRRLVQDFKTGLEYDIDIGALRCDVKRVSLAKDHVGSEVIEGSTMMSARRFFDLVSLEYCYLGEHKDRDRDVVVDVFTRMDVLGNVKYTWSFVSKDWILKAFGVRPDTMVPFRYRVGTTQTEIFNFVTPPADTSVYPDVSTCFSQGKRMYINITFNATLTKMTNQEQAQWAFRRAMTSYSSLKSSVRVQQVKIIPVNSNTTVVSFTLLETNSTKKPLKENHIKENHIKENHIKQENAPPHVAVHADGHSSTKQREVDLFGDEAASQDLYLELKNTMEAGKFLVDIHNGLTLQRMKATSITKRDADDFPKTTNKVKSQTQGYSTADYVGTGIGAFLLGLLAGFASYKMTHRLVTKTQTRRIGFKNLRESSVVMD